MKKGPYICLTSYQNPKKSSNKSSKIALTFLNRWQKDNPVKMAKNPSYNILSQSLKNFLNDPDVIQTRNLLIWSQTRYCCATESVYVAFLDVLDNRLN